MSKITPSIRMTLGEVRKFSKEEHELHHPFKYVVTAECSCTVGDKKVVVPEGFLTDGSSGGPDEGWSWLFHDYLYSTHCFADGTECTRQEADRIMYYILRYDRNFVYAFFYMLAHKLFLKKFDEAWVSSGTRGPVYLAIDY